MLITKYKSILIFIAGLLSGIIIILLINYKEDPKNNFKEDPKEKNNLIENIRNGKSLFEYSIYSDLLMTYSKYSPDTLYLYKYIHEYIQSEDPCSSDLYIPQSTILTDILLSTNFPKGYTSVFFKMGYNKIYTVLCTFYKEVSDENILNMITDINYSFSTKDKIDYEVSALLDEYTRMESYRNRVFEVQQLINFLYNLYYPIDVYKILNYKYNMKKKYTFGHYLLKEIDDVILVRDTKDTRAVDSKSIEFISRWFESSHCRYFYKNIGGFD
ncbi:hypothetical protein P3W45_000768 [Vairimorpha bombi]